MHLAGVTLEWFQKGPLLSLKFQRRGADLFVFIVAFMRVFMLVEAPFTSVPTNSATCYLPCAF